MSRRVVLASTSKYRRQLLARLGLDFETADPGVDEDAVKATSPSPQALVAQLARAKAVAVAASTPDAVIIGSDQCAELDGETLGKPGSIAAAESQLAQLAGRTHQLWTAVCVLDARSGRRMEHVDLHRLTMRPLTPDQIAGYVAKDAPIDCAGSYKIETAGAALFERVQGEDPTAIVGLPLMFVARALASFGEDVLAGR